MSAWNPHEGKTALEQLEDLLRARVSPEEYQAYRERQAFIKRTGLSVFHPLSPLWRQIGPDDWAWQFYPLDDA